MIFVASNRVVNEGAEGKNLFSGWMPEQEFEDLHFANAQQLKDGDQPNSSWDVEQLFTVATKQLDEKDKLKLKSAFSEWRKDGKKRHWVLAVHGYHQSFEENLISSQKLQDRYDVEVINFSWPADPPGGPVDVEVYRKSRKAAEQSMSALLALLETLSQSLDASAKVDAGNRPASFTLLLHSLGNLILEKLIQDHRFNGQTHIFDSVILHQADVDNKTHMDWIDKLHPSRIYVTINQFDKVLLGSDLLNPPRLGSSLKNLAIAKHPFYLDFTQGRNIEMQHNFFIGKHGNAKIYHVCKTVIRGGAGEQAAGYFDYDDALNLWRLK